MVVVGAGLLVAVLVSIDLAHVLVLLARLGWGFLLVMAAAALVFSADVASRLAVLPALPFKLRPWLWLWRVRLVGEMLKMTLERDEDTQVLAVRSFDAAYQAAGTRRSDEPIPYDVILLDVRMPGMNGLTGLRRMRELVGKVPVALMSGMLTPAEARQAMNEGAAGFVPKTLPVDELIAAVRKMAAGGRFVPKFLMVSEANESIARRDYPALQGGVMLVSTVVIGVNLLVDLTYGLINPRIRHA